MAPEHLDVLLAKYVLETKEDVFLPRPGSGDHRGYSFEFVRLFGRWASESSCREYIRLGQSALTRISGRISPELWALYAILGSAVDRAFGLAASGVVG